MTATVRHRTQGYAEIEVRGTLGAQDYRDLVPQLESEIATGGGLRALIRLVDFHGWTPSALIAA